MTIKINRRDEAFAKRVAEGGEAPGISYAKSRSREYKGFNDDFAARRLLKQEDIQQAVSVFRDHILSRDVLSRQEALIRLTEIFRAPSAAEIFRELENLKNLRVDAEVKKSKMDALNLTGVKRLKRTKYGMEVVGYDLDTLAARIMQLAGVDISRPISDEGKRVVREALTEIYKDIDAGKQ